MAEKDSLVRELPKGLIQWYKFREGARALFIAGGEECFEPLPEAMAEHGVKVECRRLTDFEGRDTVSGQMVSESGKGSGACDNDQGNHLPEGTSFYSNPFSHDILPYDYIVMAGVLERSVSPVSLLRTLRGLLSPRGVLLLGTHNRLGIRYFCGDRDPFTEKNFDGVEGYRRVGELEWKGLKGRAYAKAELTHMLESAGFEHHRFYSVLPEWTRPEILCGEDCVPRGNLEEMVTPQYHSPDTIFLEEEFLYNTLIQNGLFHVMSNGYLIECPADGEFADADQVSVSTERGRAEATATILRRDKTMEKRALYREGQEKLRRMAVYAADLNAHGIKTAGMCWEGDSLVVSQVLPDGGQRTTEYFRKLVCEDKDGFLREMDRFLELIGNSSEPVPWEEVDWEHFDPDWRRRRKDDPGKDRWRRIGLGLEGSREDLGVILRRGYINLIPDHCVCVGGEFVFYDQDDCLEQLPVHVIFQRAVDNIYKGKVWSEALISRDELLERYHLAEYQRMWGLYSWRFEERIRGEKELLEYNQSCRRDWKMVSANRYRINYSENEYERVFKDIFKGTQGRKLYLFGSGIFAEKFLEQFGNDYEVAGILDNNRERWGSRLSGIEIFSPEILKDLPEDSFKVMICIKNCVPIMRQLKEELGVSNYSVYDWHQEYPRKLPAAAGASGTVSEGGKAQPKKYHIGYIAGVFDLFHMGHLNMFRRAKEQCDYLIVGVVSDESVMVNKKTMPYMPFEERIELVRSCRYVDEAVALPTYNGDTDEAHRRYQFDVQFSGSDYADDPVWLAKKAYLEKRGAEMVFFPYTQSTSSTQLKELIQKRLL